MNSLGRVVVVMGAAVLVFDAGSALASRLLGFSYGWASIGSVVLYATAGYLAARAEGQWASGAFAGALLGVLDALVGSWIATAIGPTLPPDAAPGSVAGFAVVGLFVLLLGAFFGGIGGLAGRPRATSK